VDHHASLRRQAQGRSSGEEALYHSLPHVGIFQREKEAKLLE
jgi:hypothetical protein